MSETQPTEGDTYDIDPSGTKRFEVVEVNDAQNEARVEWEDGKETWESTDWIAYTCDRVEGGR
jgi:hypothetical protein